MSRFVSVTIMLVLMLWGAHLKGREGINSSARRSNGAQGRRRVPGSTIERSHLIIPESS